jgi:hypothetical protein
MTTLPIAFVAMCVSASTASFASSVSSVSFVSVPPSVSLDVAVRADPIVFALGGWSLGVDVATEDLALLRNTRARVSLAAFHVEVPAVLVPIVAAPPEGLRVVEDAVQTALRFDVGAGWWVGPEIYVYRLAYSRDDFASTSFAHEAYAHVSLGWRWFFARDIPVVEFFFVEPWATIGLPVFDTGGADVGGVIVSDRGFNWHATVSVGVDLL